MSELLFKVCYEIPCNLALCLFSILEKRTLHFKIVGLVLIFTSDLRRTLAPLFCTVDLKYLQIQNLCMNFNTMDEQALNSNNLMFIFFFSFSISRLVFFTSNVEHFNTIGTNEYTANFPPIKSAGDPRVAKHTL